MSSIKQITKIDNFNDLYFEVSEILNNLKNYKNTMIWWKKNLSWKSICLKGFLGKEQSFLEDHSLKSNRYLWTRHIKYFPKIKIYLESLNTEIFLVRLLKLSANSKINPHRDKTFEDKQKKIRLHIPLITNDKVTFKILNKQYKYNRKVKKELIKKVWINKDIAEFKLSIGNLWYVNVDNIHSVENNGNTDRIHLVIDLKPTEDMLKIINSE